MIKLDEIINFIVPAFFLPDSFLVFSEDVLQSVFFTTIFSLFIVTLISVLINAKNNSWDKKWYTQDKNKKFNAEYITVDEVSQAAETKSEKLANAMPSILLTIGLLGTFIGLGIALDKASSILASTGGVDNTENQMIQLMAMLDGLGAKFKTSTWGLTAFILLKFLLSFIGYEDKRLEWAANKVKEELDKINKDKKLESELKNNEFSNQMSTLSSTITQALLETQSQNKRQFVVLSEFTKDLVNDNRTENTQQAVRFSENTTNKKDNNAYLVAAINNRFNKLIAVMDSHQEVSQLLQKENIAQNKDVRDAMVGFIEENKQVIGALSESASKMSGAATNMGQSASQLEIVISNLRTDMEGVISLLKNDLSNSITDMNSSFSENMGDMTNGLQNTISDMNSSFKVNISEMSVNLKGATEDISDAVKSLSSSVEKTMSEVTSTIKKSMDLQTNAQSAFTQSTVSLNGYVVEMTGLVEKLSGDIMSGLNAVSSSNRNMIGLTKKVEDVFSNLDALSALNNSLKSLDKTLMLRKDIDFTPVLAHKTQHHNELLLKIENLIKSTAEAKDNISKELIRALKYKSSNDFKPATQEA